MIVRLFPSFKVLAAEIDDRKRAWIMRLHKPELLLSDMRSLASGLAHDVVTGLKQLEGSNETYCFWVVQFCGAWPRMVLHGRSLHCRTLLQSGFKALFRPRSRKPKSQAER